MSLVKLKDKGQVTIPAAVRSQVAAQAGDMFEVVVANGNIVLKPQQVTSRKPSHKVHENKGVDISRFIGTAKGLFGDQATTDAYVSKERDSWD